MKTPVKSQALTADALQSWGKSAFGDMLKLLKQQVFSHLQGVEWTFNSTFSMLRRRWAVLAGCVGGGFGSLPVAAGW